MQQVATSNMQFEQNMNATIKDMQIQIGQLATTINQLQRQDSGNILTQPIINPKTNVNHASFGDAKRIYLMMVVIIKKGENMNHASFDDAKKIT